MADLLAVVPEGLSLPDRVAAVADIARDALVATALAATGGSRRDAAALLKVAEERVTEALRRFPWLARVYPGKRGRKPATVKAYVKAQQGEPAPSGGAASSPTSAAAKGRGIRGSTTGSKNR